VQAEGELDLARLADLAHRGVESAEQADAPVVAEADAVAGGEALGGPRESAPAALVDALVQVEGDVRAVLAAQRSPCSAARITRVSLKTSASPGRSRSGRSRTMLSCNSTVSPSPSWGGVRGGGSPNGECSAIPLPNPPPRGGRELSRSLRRWPHHQQPRRIARGRARARWRSRAGRSRRGRCAWSEPSPAGLTLYTSTLEAECHARKHVSWVKVGLHFQGRCARRPRPRACTPERNARARLPQSLIRFA
jgi:hypothetical protein